MILAYGPTDNIVYYFLKKFSSIFFEDTMKKISPKSDLSPWVNIDRFDNTTKLIKDYQKIQA